MRVAKSITLIAILIAASVYAVPIAAADTNPDIIVTPANINLNLDPGESSSQKVTIVNDSTIDRDFQIKLISFANGDNDGKPMLDESLVTPLHDWLKLHDQTFTVPAKHKFELNFIVDVPADAGPGSYRTAILFSDLHAQITESGSAVVAQLGPLLFVRISGEARESAAITKFSPANQVTEVLPVAFNLEISNLGNVDITPIGVVNISPQLALDNHQYHFNFNPTTSKILAGTARGFDTAWVADGWHFGYYRAEIVLAYGQSNTILTTETDFWVIPWKAIGAGLVLLATLLIVVKFRNKPDIL